MERRLGCHQGGLRDALGDCLLVYHLIRLGSPGQEVMQELPDAAVLLLLAFEILCGGHGGKRHSIGRAATSLPMATTGFQAQSPDFLRLAGHRRRAPERIILTLSIKTKRCAFFSVCMSSVIQTFLVSKHDERG